MFSFKAMTVDCAAINIEDAEGHVDISGAGRFGKEVFTGERVQDCTEVKMVQHCIGHPSLSMYDPCMTQTPSVNASRI